MNHAGLLAWADDDSFYKLPKVKLMQPEIWTIQVVCCTLHSLRRATCNTAHDPNSISGSPRPLSARSEVTHVSWTVPYGHNGLRRSVSWNARNAKNAGTILGSSSSRQCGWLPLETRPRPRWRGNWVFG